jgi:hypothetical protein
MVQVLQLADAMKTGNFMKLYKFRALQNDTDFKRIICILEEGFYCNNFFNFNDMNEGVYRNNQLNKDITFEEKNNYNICSFSGEKALNNELMWGHYANAGKGIAIEIKMNTCMEIAKNVLNTDEDEFGDFSNSNEKAIHKRPNDKNLHRVIYKDNKNDLNTIEEILTHKSLIWEYEDEWRYLSNSNENPIQIGTIEKIYFGTPYEHLHNYNDIQSKNQNLQEYLKLKKKLIRLINKKYSNIDIIDYSFSKLK